MNNNTTLELFIQLISIHNILSLIFHHPFVIFVIIDLNVIESISTIDFDHLRYHFLDILAIFLSDLINSVSNCPFKPAIIKLCF